MNNLNLQELQDCSTRLVKNVHAAVIVWLMGLEEKFVIALQQQELVATLALTHWGSVAERSTGRWWFFKSGQPLVKELSSSLSNLSECEQVAQE